MAISASEPTAGPAPGPGRRLVCALSGDIGDLDVTGTLRFAEGLSAAKQLLDVEEVRLGLQYADLHGADPGEVDPDPVPGANTLVEIGGEGTPRVQDLSLCELAVARGVSEYSTRQLVADGLDLAHRLPQTWTKLEDGHGEVWVARRIARLSRALDLTAVAAVDDAVAAVIGLQGPARVLAVAEEAVMAADTEAAREEREARRRRRCVRIGRSDQDGLRTIYARIEAGDAAWIDAMLEYVADLLLTRPDLIADLPPDPTRDELRAEAMGWLAHPVDLFALLGGTLPIRHPDGPPAPDPDPETQREDAPAPKPSTRGEAVVYVHLSEAAVQGATTPTDVVGRVEGIGPMLLEDLQALLGHAHITLKPVIDLNQRRAVDGHDHPPDVRERTFLRMGGDAFPHAPGRSRKVDHDHPKPYDEHGPPGQTGDENDAPLGRRPHRAKTHLGYQVTQLDLGVYLWRTPHGLSRLVDTTGTHKPDELERTIRSNPRSRRTPPAHADERTAPWIRLSCDLDDDRPLVRA